MRKRIPSWTDTLPPAYRLPAHDCMEHAVPVKTDGPLGHGWECGLCGKFLQAG